MVCTWAPSACSASTLQAFTAWPSTNTVQAPHCAVSQPTCVPAEPHAVREALEGNICRCTGYEGIVAAICDGLGGMRRAAEGGA